MNVGPTLFNQKPSDMSRFSRVIYFGTTEHTDDMDEKENSAPGPFEVRRDLVLPFGDGGKQRRTPKT
jgi:hypothetical protein